MLLRLVKDVHSSGITIAMHGYWFCDTDAMSISATGIVTFSQIPSVPINTIEISTQTRGAFLVIESGGTDGAGANAGDNIIDETDSDDIIHESATDLVGSVFNIIDSAGMVVRTINSV